MARSYWVISDTHFGHENIIKYCDRPFSSVHEMNEHMRDRWNSVVKDGDNVYHLGDVYFGKGMNTEDRDYAMHFLQSLKGRKRLVLGNHDNGKDQVLQRVFQKIVVWYDFKQFDMLMSHVPVHPGSLLRNGVDKLGSINVHGHLHNNLVMDNNVGLKLPDKRYKNVCVEHTDYAPINLEELRDKIKNAS